MFQILLFRGPNMWSHEKDLDITPGGQSEPNGAVCIQQNLEVRCWDTIQSFWMLPENQESARAIILVQTR